ncbi:unnamed protein product [Ilex paraguariensis]|uniref:Uncharacterized protein n=1 Tax=Ilex paraguariensis TaxID=185542 RepID=A0ABC8RRE2_9AQUA
MVRLKVSSVMEVINIWKTTSGGAQDVVGDSLCKAGAGDASMVGPGDASAARLGYFAGVTKSLGVGDTGEFWVCDAAKKKACTSVGGGAIMAGSRLCLGRQLGDAMEAWAMLGEVCGLGNAQETLENPGEGKARWGTNQSIKKP